MINVTVVLVEGGMPSTAVAPVEIFDSAGKLWNTMRGEPARPFFRVRTASLDGAPVKTGVCLNLTPDGCLDDIRSADVIIVSAVGADIDAASQANRPLYPWLRYWHTHGAIIAGVCAGVALVAEAGLLDGHPATTHWGVVEACRRRYPEVQWQPERLLTESDRRLCSGGVYASVDLSLYLVEKFCGHQVAMETAKALLLETPRTWQIGYAAEPPQSRHEDARILKAQEWLFHHFDTDIRLEDVAEQVALTPRTFARRFKLATGETPMNYLHRIRINAARHMLENDARGIHSISEAVGYDDTAFFRRIFKRHTGQSPGQYRQRFGISPPESVAISARTPHR
ncbi:helix-turn-helix domain-containing protein [Marinobacter sp. TBZ242]|uniref:Helix-turn-helix domain-containing protein n=1 Tax=Marinobacter azerbaijanicus TaxID=3050455 RepID=A0ABT7I725_9GAMM|nr:helix-turn-helix domain-containing protein [Marinobacter sp. TBZ242]MDL0429949.1 helix-turn-helix domain-containing protein [Marinobacter sp. TBZ242]